MQLYNTLTRRLEEFRPLENKKVIMYVCGLTPYDNAHLGHARTYVAFDLLKRYLLYKGYKVFHIQNITDVDDKLIKKAQQTGKNPLEIASRFHEKALLLFDKLNILRADIYPRVSEHIADIINFIKVLLDKGYAYETETGVYFDVSKFPDYGKLSGQNLSQLEKHRIEPDPKKRHPADFALWKKKKEVIWWQSPFGEGRPGWHIECSAMSLKYSKNRTLDIHGGAKDLIFPHHENEIAQSEAYLGKPFVKYWVHTGFLTVEGEKMSKSLGNFITLEEALSKHEPEVLRLMFLTRHYASPIDYSEALLSEAKKNLEKIRHAYSMLTKEGEQNNVQLVINIREKFFASLDNNLDTPRALAVFYELVSFINQHGEEGFGKEFRELASLLFREFEFIFGIKLHGREKTLEALKNILSLRQQLRNAGNYEIADKIREAITKAGIKVIDKKDKSEMVI